MFLHWQKKISFSQNLKKNKNQTSEKKLYSSSDFEWKLSNPSHIEIKISQRVRFRIEKNTPR